MKWVATSSSRGSSLTQGSNLDLLNWQVDSLLSELPGKHRLNEGRRSCKPMKMGLLGSNNNHQEELYLLGAGTVLGALRMSND